MLIDEETAYGERVARRLREESVIWLTTVTSAGAPVPSPVWFLWDGQKSVWVFSLDDTPRVRNIQTNPRVTLNFDGDGQGGDIIVLSGEATLERDAPGAADLAGYAEKYQGGFERLRMTAPEFAARYCVPVRVRLTRLRGH